MTQNLACRFSFVRLGPGWRAMSGPERLDRLNDLQELVTHYQDVRVDHYLPAISDPPCDFLLRWEAGDPGEMEELAERMQSGSVLGEMKTLRTAAGRTRPPRYINPEQQRDLARTQPPPDLKRHAFLFFISRTREWEHFPEAERRKMVQEHVEAGMHFHDALFRRCYYCDGVDPQQDFIYYIESNHPDRVEEAYGCLKGLKDANYWARHGLVFRGTPVTLAEWQQRVAAADAMPPSPEPPGSADQPIA